MWISDEIISFSLYNFDMRFLPDMCFITFIEAVIDQNRIQKKHQET